MSWSAKEIILRVNGMDFLFHKLDGFLSKLEHNMKIVQQMAE